MGHGQSRDGAPGAPGGSPGSGGMGPGQPMGAGMGGIPGGGRGGGGGVDPMGTIRNVVRTYLPPGADRNRVGRFFRNLFSRMGVQKIEGMLH